MTADQLPRFGLTARHAAIVIRYWQAAHGINADGNATQETLDSLEASGRAERDNHDGATLMRRATAVARSEIGNGEDAALGNNRSEAIYRYRKGDRTNLPWDIARPWCASFASYCFVQAADGLGAALPFRTSRGAKTLTERIADAGRECTFPEPNSVICWHRSRLGAASRKGHVAFVSSYDLATDTLITIDGNKNRRGRWLATVEEFQHPNGRWRNRLYMIATLAPRG